MASKVVLITGCSTGGIGYHLCQEFARRGCTVYATSRRLKSMEGLTGHNIHTRELDVRDEDAVNRVVQDVIREAGKIDILVSNAGWMTVAPVPDLPLEKVKDMFDTNTFGFIRLTRAIIPHMVERRSGTILVVGSVTGLIPTPWSGAYAASKAALHSLAQNVQMECAPFGIKCMLIAPGSVKSSIAQNSSEGYVLPKNSLWKNYSDAILARLWASQTTWTMPTETFARQIVDKALRQNPPRFVSIGGGALIWKILLWLPRSLALYALWSWHGNLNKQKQ